MTKIMISPQELWDYYTGHRRELAISRHEIANCWEYGVAIYITATNSFPEIVVDVDDEEVYREEITLSDCEQVANTLYECYLTTSAMQVVGGEGDAAEDTEEDTEEEEPYTTEEEIEERESELEEATRDFVSVATNGALEHIDQKAIDDLTEHFLEYMARKWGIDIYRPMFLEDEEGQFHMEKPYKHMVFDDEDNPIYKKEK